MCGGTIGRARYLTYEYVSGELQIPIVSATIVQNMSRTLLFTAFALCFRILSLNEARTLSEFHKVNAYLSSNYLIETFIIFSLVFAYVWFVDPYGVTWLSQSWTTLRNTQSLARQTAPLVLRTVNGGHSKLTITD